MRKRISRESLYSQIAQLFAERSTCKRGHVGAIAVKEGRIVASGYNGAPPDFTHCSKETCDLDQPCEKAIHAEANLVAFAARKGISLENSVLYCTHMPCQKCAELIVQAGVTEVNFLYPYRTVSGQHMLNLAGISTKKL